MRLLKLISIPDLILLAFVMLVFRYGFLEQQQAVVPALNGWQYGLLVLSCICIAAGGFLMNAISGIGQSKPAGLSEAQGYNLYIVFTLIGIGIGYYIANYVGKPMYVGIFGVAAATIYMYATSLKQTLLISNIIISLIMALPIVAIGIFNLYPILTPLNQPFLATLFSLLLDYAIFTFAISLILTFVNDLANTDSDYNSGTSTLPVILGKDRTVKIVCGLTIVPMAMLIYYINTQVLDMLWAFGYALLFIVGPMIYFIIKIWGAKTSKDFNHLVVVLKMVLLFTAISIAIITLNIKYSA